MRIMWALLAATILIPVVSYGKITIKEIIVADEDIDIEQSGTGDIRLRDGSEGTAGHIWTSTGTDGAGNWAAAPAGGISNVVEDTTPQLGGSLDINGQKFTSGATDLFFLGGTESTYFGENSGNFATPANNNAGFGHNSLTGITTGNGNSGFGRNSCTSVTTSSNATCIGHSANASSGGSNFAGGSFANAGAGGAVALGNLAGATGSSSLSMGNQSDATANNAIAHGLLAQATADSAIALGANATNSEADTLRVGDDDFLTWKGAPGFTIKPESGIMTLASAVTEANKVTADPCGTYSEGAIFYNDTANIPCYCDQAGDDLKFSDNTACF